MCCRVPLLNDWRNFAHEFLWFVTKRRFGNQPTITNDSIIYNIYEHYNYSLSFQQWSEGLFLFRSYVIVSI